MRKTIQTNEIILLLLLCILLNSVTNSISESSIEYETYMNVSDTKKTLTGEPIYIDGDTQLLTSNLLGDGTEEKPFVISGLTINGNYTEGDSSTIYSLIEIRNVNYYLHIKNCNLIRGYQGISLSNTPKVVLSDNLIQNNQVAVSIGNSGGTIMQESIYKISNNTIINNVDGMFIGGSASLKIENNYIYNNSEGIIGGISVSNVPNALIQDNKIVNNTGSGININIMCSDLHIVNNTIIENEEAGILVSDNSFIKINDNSISSNGWCGICFFEVLNSTVRNNTIFNNNLGYGATTGGIALKDSSYNTIQWNDFISNINYTCSSQAYDDRGSRNIYDHNYWNEWTSPDENLDGLVDTPYEISTRDRYFQDDHPLVYSRLYTLSLPKIISPNAKELLQDKVKILWKIASDSLNSSVKYSVYYSYISNGSPSNWTTIEEEIPTTNILWDTNTLPDGNYLIKVTAVSSLEVKVETISDSIYTINNTVIYNTSDTIISNSNTNQIFNSSGLLFIEILPILCLFVLFRRKFD